MEHITSGDCKHTKRVWEGFGIQNLIKYNDLYVLYTIHYYYTTIHYNLCINIQVPTASAWKIMIQTKKFYILCTIM